MKRLKKVRKWWSERVIEGNYLAAVLPIAVIGGAMFLTFMPTPINRFLVEDAGPTIVGWLAKAITFVIEFIGKTFTHVINDVRAIGRALLAWYVPAIEQIVYGGFRWQWLPYVAVATFVLAVVLVWAGSWWILCLIADAVKWCYARRPVVMWRSRYEGILRYEADLRTAYEKADSLYHFRAREAIEREEKFRDTILDLERRLYETRGKGVRAVQAIREELTEMLLADMSVSRDALLGPNHGARPYLEARRRKPVATTAATPPPTA